MTADKGKDVIMVESCSGGVKPMNIAGRMVHERQRVAGMTDAERAWRAQWLKDQILAPDEPKIPENYYKERYNPIRRFYRAPMDLLEGALAPKIGPLAAEVTRHVIAKSVMGFIGCLCAIYYFKYNTHDWTREGGWRVAAARTKMYSNDPNWPNYEEKTKGTDYAVYGFDKSPI